MWKALKLVAMNQKLVVAISMHLSFRHCEGPVGLVTGMKFHPNTHPTFKMIWLLDHVIFMHKYLNSKTIKEFRGIIYTYHLFVLDQFQKMTIQVKPDLSWTQL